MPRRHGWGNVELRHLKYFQAITTEAGFSRAAAKLRVAQPALSRQVRALEQELCTDLLVRTARGVVPTMAGEVLVRGASEILETVNEGLKRVQRAGRGRAGFCRVGVSKPVLWSGMLSRVLSVLGAEDIELEIVETEGPEQWTRLVAGSLDIGIGLGPPSTETRLTTEPILLSTIDSALLPADHPLANRRAVTGEHLEPYPLLALSPSVQEDIHLQISPLLEQAGIRSARRVTYPTMQSIWTLVAAGRGWTLTSSHWGSPPEGTVSIPVKELKIPFHLALMSQSGEERGHVQRVMEAFRRVRDDLGFDQAVSGEYSGRVRRRPTSFDSIDLRQLRYYATVVDSGGFARGAAKLGITQPALSRQIKNLEAGIGVQLVKRVPRGIRLTPSGEVLRGEVERIEQGMFRLRGEIVAAARGMRGQVVIGAVTTPITARLIAAAMRAMGDVANPVEPHVLDVSSPEQPDALRAGRIDIGICHAYPEPTYDAAICRERLVDDVLECALVSRDHPLAGRAMLEPAELESIPFLFMPRPFHPTFYDRIFNALAAIDLRPMVEREYAGLHTVWALSAEGLGWALGFRSHRTQPPEGLVAIPIRGLELPWGLDLLWRRKDLNPHVSAIVEALQKAR
jgi:DNA-binding transcriptional LysR family regulator